MANPRETGEESFLRREKPAAKPPASPDKGDALTKTNAPPSPPLRPSISQPPAPPRTLTPASGTPLSKQTRTDYSPLSTTTPVSNASPLGVGAAGELAPAAVAPAIPTGPEKEKLKAGAGEVAATAASILGGGGDDREKAAMRESLEESAALARASASARARVAALRARGASLPELDGRLAAAELLSRRGEPAAALKVLEEVLVLSNALVAAFGVEGTIDLPDPLETRIDARLERVFEKASEAARARTDELLSSARLAEKVEEICRARVEELLVSKRLSAKIEEVAQRHAESVVSAAVEALLTTDAFKHAVDSRARARAEEAFASVKAGASPEAIEGAVERVIARRDRDGNATPQIDLQALEEQLVPLVSSLVKQTITDEQAVVNKIRSLIAQELTKVAPGGADRDEIQLRRLVDAEIARYEAVAQPTEKALSDQASALARSEAMKQLMDEQIEVLRASVKKDVVEELERIAAANKKKVSDAS